ncbi:MAG: hypothetical protein K2W96_01430 [Gemmataceae bacterium]|nr:hypothetical protein [Gemmataceae bacterium]
MPRRALFALLLLAGPALGDVVIVEGYGEDAPRAWDWAMKAAQSHIRLALPDEFGAKRWGDDAPALAPALLKRTRAVEKAGDPEPSVVVGGQRQVMARYRVSLTEEYLAEVRKLRRAEVAQARAWLAGRVAAWLLVAFAVAAAWMKLEDWTRGYATRLLRLLAAGALALAALALWAIG